MLSHMKRTTLVLDDRIYGELKHRAVIDHHTLTETVERALRLGLDAMATRRRGRIRLPSYDLGPFLVDPSDRSGWPEVPAERTPIPEEGG